MFDGTGVHVDVEGFARTLEAGVPAIDLRPLPVFARGHIPGAINVAYVPGRFTAEVQDAVDTQEVTLVEDIPALTARALSELAREGLRVAAVLAGGTRAWQAAGRPLAQLEQVTADELYELLRREDARVTVIDVREAYELQTGRIPAAVHVPLGLLPHKMREMDKEREYVLVCASGSRSAVAQVYMHRHGFRRVRNLVGGMAVWLGSGRPVVR